MLATGIRNSSWKRVVFLNPLDGEVRSESGCYYTVSNVSRVA